MVDAAVPPVRKAKPSRALIVIMATLTGFLFAVLFVLLYTWWQRHHAYVAHRLNASIATSAPPRRTVAVRD